MIRYALRRLALAVSLVWGVSFVAFVGAALSLDPLWQERFGCATPSCLRQLHEDTIKLHLNDPVIDRYWLWLSGLLRHGFQSIWGDSYASYLLRSVEVTSELMACALVLTALLAVAVGVASARRAGRPPDLLLRFLSYIAWSLPSFLVATLALHWLGPTGWFLTGAPPGRGYVSGSFGRLPSGGFIIWLRGMTLPAVTLSVGLIGLYARYLRTMMLAELHRPYVVVARSKGLSETRVAYRHALRNSLVPFVSVLSLEFGAILGASIGVDYVFQMGGLAGSFLGDLTQSSDPYVLANIVVAAAGIVTIFMLLGDLAIGWLDPRVRAGTAG
ncbi:MAG: ABC transporter permease [Gaiellaceae bacterium]